MEGLGLTAGSISTGRLKHTICTNYRECDVCQIGTLDYFSKYNQVINFSRAGKMCSVTALLFTSYVYIAIYIYKDRFIFIIRQVDLLPFYR